MSAELVSSAGVENTTPFKVDIEKWEISWIFWAALLNKNQEHLIPTLTAPLS